MKLTLYRHAQVEQIRALNPVKIPFYELIILLKGQMEYFVNQERVLLQDGDMLFIKHGSIRRRKASDEPVDYISIHFLSEEEMDLPVKIQGNERSSIPAIVMTADKLWKEFYPEAEPLIEHLIECLLHYIKLVLTRRSDIPLVFDLKRFMLKHLNQNLTVAEIAAQFLISPSYCNAVFKRETGVPLLKYFTQLRIENAKKLLASDELTLIDVATSIGFADYGYFARTFKKYTGITPLQYKKKFLK